MLLCWNDVIQPCSQDAIEKGVHHQHNKATRNWESGNLHKIEFSTWLCTLCTNDVSLIALKITWELQLKSLFWISCESKQCVICYLSWPYHIPAHVDSSDVKFKDLVRIELKYLWSNSEDKYLINAHGKGGRAEETDGPKKTWFWRDWKEHLEHSNI